MNRRPTIGAAAISARLLLFLALAVMPLLVTGSADRVAAGQPVRAIDAPMAPGTYVLNLATGAVVQVSSAMPAGVVWSPAGKQLAVTGDSLQVIDAGTGASRQVATPTSVAVRLVAWSPDGSALAYTQAPVGRRPAPDDPRLLVLHIDDLIPDPLAYTDAIGMSWTPVGDGITAEFLQLGQDDVLRASLSTIDPTTGATIQDLAGGPELACAFEPAWSPDGRFLSLTGPFHQGCGTAGGTLPGVWSLEAATGELRQLYAGGNGAAKWMADGTILAEVCCATPPAPGVRPLYFLEALAPDGSATRTIAGGLNEPFPGPYDVAFDTAQGVVLYAQKDCAANTASAWTVDTAGGAPRQLSDPSVYAYRPRLSPDGRSAAWISVGAATSDLTLVALDGSGARTLLSGAPGLTDLSWSPDGSSLLFTVTDQQFKDCIEP